MSDSALLDGVKHKVRELKHLEIKIRFGGGAYPAEKLVWNRFFGARGPEKAKYPLEILAAMSRETYRAVVDEYFAYVYFELYRENGFVFPEKQYDPEILAKLGLGPGADERDVKRRFRELAKQYHPDTGGDAAKFIELMDNYRRLIN